MKKLFLSTLLLALPLLASAYDIAVENSDGVTIYYNYYNNGTELEVTSSGDYDNRYSGVVNIPEEVTYMSRTRKVTSIGWGAFSSCSNLTSVTIPISVTSIGEGAFQGCSGLTSVTIPNSVTSIGGSAFYGCSGLASITIGNSVTSIEGGAFYGCVGLKKVIVKNLAAWCSISFSLFENSSWISSNNPLYYAQHLYSDENTEITDLVIPNTVTSIGRATFIGCSSINSITIPKSLTSIGAGAFYGCSSLKKVIVEDIAAWCAISFPYYYSTYFTGNHYANPLVLAKHLYSDENTEIKNLVIPNSVTTIGEKVFSGCTGLTSVTIPNSVTSIGDYAFSGCSGLISVVSKMTNPCYINDGCFLQDVFYNTTLYVPKGTTDKYKSTDYWSRFVFIEEGEPGSSTQPEEKKCATPKISYSNKKLTFSCATEEVEYHYTINDADIKSAVANSIDLSATYEISVYATKSGYTNSDVATATLVWTDAVFTETTPSTSSAKAIAESIPMLISAQNGTITVRGEQNGLPLTVYSADGKLLGAATMKDGQASISTNLQRGGIAIVKVGSKSVKIKM